jgi:hypothetical protein
MALGAEFSWWEWGVSVGLENGDWIAERMERNGELRYMMNGHYDIDFLLPLSLSLYQQRYPISYFTTTERTNKRMMGGYTCLGDHPPLFFFFFFFEMSWNCQTCMANHGMQGGGVLDITFPFGLYVYSTERADG